MTRDKVHLNEPSCSAVNPHKGDDSSSKVDRRQFLCMATMSSALLMLDGRRLGAAPLAPNSRSYAALQSLPPGAARPEGWLRGYLQKQLTQLGSRLPEVSWPFTAPYWSGEETATSWWPWENKAYWIDGATRLAIVMNDETLLRKVQSIIDYTLTHASPDGYVGPGYLREPTADYHRWPHTVFFRSLMAATDAKPAGDQHVVEVLQKHYLSDHADYAQPNRNVTNIELMLWCYGQSGDIRMLAMAENTWREYMKKVAVDPGHGDLSWLRVYEDTPIDSHGVTYAETSKLPAILYVYTGKQEYLKFALAAQRRIFDYHMLIDGIPSTTEWYRGRTSLDSHETCDIVDHVWTWGYLLMATGDGVWADRIERACFNAGSGAIKKDWKALQYFSCPNQFLATLDSDHNGEAFGGRHMAFEPNPGEHASCCGGNVHRLMPNYLIRMWMESNDGGLIAALYGPSAIKTAAGPGRVPMEVLETTGYPFDEEITFSFNTAEPVTFPFSLRIPNWCRKPNLSVNGVPTPLPAARSGYATLHREFKTGDKLVLHLQMKLAISRWPQGGIAIEHGPLVYSLPIKENWKAITEPKYTNPEFTSWNATPASPWNYGIDLNSSALENQIKIQRQPLTKDPWSDPPLTLAVPARRIEGWELLVNPENPDQKFTPALPDLNSCKVSASVETITLVPLGATQLRVTIFPDVNRTDNQEPELRGRVAGQG
jgi:hypothetical protein